MSNAELEVLRGFYAAVGAELGNWHDGASIRVLRRAHAMLAPAVGATPLVPTAVAPRGATVLDGGGGRYVQTPAGRKWFRNQEPECNYHNGPHQYQPDWNTYTNRHEERCLCGLRKAEPECPVWGSGRHFWEPGDGFCRCGSVAPTPEPEAEETSEDPACQHRWAWADDDNGESLEELKARLTVREE